MGNSFSHCCWFNNFTLYGEIVMLHFRKILKKYLKWVFILSGLLIVVSILVALLSALGIWAVVFVVLPLVLGVSEYIIEEEIYFKDDPGPQ